MLINVMQPEECRIAIIEDGVLQELYVERTSQESYVNNIYKGKVVNIEPSIQAAFVDFGIGRNGFLHVSDVDPAYYKHLLSKEDLAAYEAEMDREYGGGGGGRGRDRDRDRGGRDRDRGPRERAPREMTSWLEPQPPALPARSAELSDDEDFAAGLADEAPAAEAGAEAAPVEDADMFAALQEAQPLPDVSEDQIGPIVADFATISHLYRSIEDGLERLAEGIGEEKLFIGPLSAQATGDQFGRRRGLVLGRQDEERRLPRLRVGVGRPAVEDAVGDRGG